MATPSKEIKLRHRDKGAPSNSTGSESQPKNVEEEQTNLEAHDLIQWKRHIEAVKADLLEQIQGQLSDLLDRAMKESAESYSRRNPVLPSTTNVSRSGRNLRMEHGKVFMERKSILDELFEINHIRTLYHMFIAALLLLIISTLAVDYIDQGRLVLDFDLLFYAFGKLPTVLWAWMIMFSYTLAGPYHTLTLWGSHYHGAGTPRRVLTVGCGVALAAAQSCILGVFPVYVVIHHQLPAASRFIIILEQVRFLMKSYSFIRENVPVIMNHKPQGGEDPRLPTFSSYLYFLFCPTLIYRESYPRNPYIRWNYVGVNFAKVLGCLFYLYFILVRLCIPVLMNENNHPLSTRTLVLSLFHATLPGMLILLLAFFAFLHCWLNAFAEMLRFADRMFYKDWWNSTSFANYYRTWNVVVHDWLYYYYYQDFLWLTRRKFRTTAKLSVFLMSAVVHEYVFTLCFGFFYPVMFCLFAVIGVVFNFTLNDKRKGPVWNVIMWTCLFIGQGVQVCLYCHEWYAQVHCPRAGVGTARHDPSTVLLSHPSKDLLLYHSRVLDPTLLW
ncbi:sterol O-acyltransferase 2 isoform X2 [Paramormyrops kingsleyae]|uniref:sterol O-acyltransferase 2 isoform X2 n=1 Tax=Paramormyrops kingsleyae TaxID=1676925 RepID=UPI000CD5FFA2|nr:sterol O-acyltransferase 2 isoform X2 [Paramormyrops kingsleyae]